MSKTMYPYGIEELKAQGIAKLTEALDSEVEEKENILDRKIQINEQEDYIEIELTYEVLEQIGTKEKIVF